MAKSVTIPNSTIVLVLAMRFFRENGKSSFFTNINLNCVHRDFLIIKNLREIKHHMPMPVSGTNKSFIGETLKKENPSDRLAGSLTAEAVCVSNGADIIRTHNVAETKEVVEIATSHHKIKKGL